MIVAFNGRTGSGKDHAAAHINKLRKLRAPHMPENYQIEKPIVKFAYALRNALSVLTGITIEEMWTTQQKEAVVKLVCPKQEWQLRCKLMGHEMNEPTDVFAHLPFIACENGMRLNGSIGRLLQIIGSIYRDIDPSFWVKRCNVQPGCIITDLRYQEEVAEIRKYPSLIVHIERPGHYELAGRDPNHSSETQDIKADLVIYNVGTLEAYETQIEMLLNYVDLLEVKQEVDKFHDPNERSEFNDFKRKIDACVKNTKLYFLQKAKLYQDGCRQFTDVPPTETNVQ